MEKSEEPRPRGLAPHPDAVTGNQAVRSAVVPAPGGEVVHHADAKRALNREPSAGEDDHQAEKRDVEDIGADISAAAQISACFSSLFSSGRILASKLYPLEAEGPLAPSRRSESQPRRAMLGAGRSCCT